MATTTAPAALANIDALARALQDPHLDAANRAHIMGLIQAEAAPLARDYAAEYVAARTAARRPGAALADRAAAQKVAARVATAARRAGQALDEIALDEQARAALYAK